MKIICLQIAASCQIQMKYSYIIYKSKKEITSSKMFTVYSLPYIVKKACRLSGSCLSNIPVDVCMCIEQFKLQINIYKHLSLYICIYCYYLFFSAASKLGIKDLLPAYLGTNLSNEDLITGVSFASGGTGFDPITSQLAV